MSSEQEFSVSSPSLVACLVSWLNDVEEQVRQKICNTPSAKLSAMGSLRRSGRRNFWACKKLCKNGQHFILSGIQPVASTPRTMSNSPTTPSKHSVGEQYYIIARNIYGGLEGVLQFKTCGVIEDTNKGQGFWVSMSETVCLETQSY